MENIHFTGLSIAISTFLVIGLFHPIVIKVEYYFGVRLWWIFLLAGIAFIVGSMLTANVIASSILGVLGASCLWSIGELFEQKQRVKKGWFPMNPKRKEEYEDWADTCRQDQRQTLHQRHQGLHGAHLALHAFQHNHHPCPKEHQEPQRGPAEAG